jgi:hypothetical protein
MGVGVVAVTAIIAIAIAAIAVFAIAVAAIFSVTAIAIIVAVLPLRHIYAIEYCAGIGEFVFPCQ